MLLVLIAVIFYEAFHRFIHKVEVKSLEMLTIAVIGLIANSTFISFLPKYSLNLNIKATLFHILGDAISSIGVIIGALMIFFTKWYTIDLIIGAVISVIIVYDTGKMLSTTLHILL